MMRRTLRLLGLTCLLTAPGLPALAASLSVSPEKVPVGGSLTISWSGIPSPRNGDWIGLYQPGEGHGSYRQYWFTGGRGSGSGTITVDTAGSYELRLFVAGTFQLLATSNWFTVGEVNESGALHVEPVPSEPTTADSVAIHSAGAWPDTCVPQGGRASVSGNRIAIRFPARDPRGACASEFTLWSETTTVGRLPAGTYEVQVFYGDDLLVQDFFTVRPGAAAAEARLEVSPAVARVGETITAKWSGIASPQQGDWIGFYLPGDADSAFRYYWFTGGAASGSVRFSMPAAGTFELRLFRAGSLDRLASASFSVR